MFFPADRISTVKEFYQNYPISAVVKACIALADAAANSESDEYTTTKKDYKRRAAGGRVPGIGTGVTSRMSVIVIPAATILCSTCPRPREGPCISR